MGFSPSIFPRPADWGEHLQICGYLDHQSDTGKSTISKSLDQFLEAGPAPVFMTFGSLEYLKKFSSSTSLFVEAAQLAECRAIIQVQSLADCQYQNSDQIHFIENEPHDQIFPSCAMVVHHGGAGTTHTTCKAGCPSIVVAHIGDQRVWGYYLKRLGVAPDTLFRKSITPKQLAEAIKTVYGAKEMNEKATFMASAMQQEHGVEGAVEKIEDLVRREINI